jgi:hypothetical protein
MSILSDFLEKAGLKYEDLSTAEQETLHSWMEVLQRNELTLAGVTQYIRLMKDSIEQEVSSVSHNSKQDIFLKARLRNYILLESFLSSPEKAKAALERQMAGIAVPKNK